MREEHWFLFVEIDGEPVGFCSVLPDCTLRLSSQEEDRTAADRTGDAAGGALTTTPDCS